MDNGIELVSDGDGLAVIGESSAVERFLATLGLPSKDLGLPRLSKVLSLGAGAHRSRPRRLPRGWSILRAGCG